MLDDKNDKRIKEAADHYHPEYDVKAWQKMEQLLDKQLPVEKDRRPVLLLITLILFMGYFLFLFLYHLKKNTTEAPQTIVLKNKAEKAVESNSVDVSKKTKPQDTLGSNINLVTITKANSIEKNNRNSIEEKSEKAEPIKSSVTKQKQNPLSALENNLPSIQDTNKREEITPGNSSNSNTIEANKINTPSVPKQNETGEEKPSRQTKTNAVTNNEKTGKQLPGNNPEKIRKSNAGFADNFGINVSAGPDVSDVYHNTIGKLTIAYGAGLSYNISKKLSIRTGFYSSKKIYSVAGDDYKIPPGSIGNYQYLENVEANCKVYEIPVKLGYSFGKIKNHSWFVSTGLSSYLMKKESYDYYYKTPTGQIYNKDWSISNKNRHFFSVLDISGGYQYSFSSQFSLIAEPYVNLPLTGIGAGKVKLNSGGILFTIQAKPFLKKK